MNSILITTNSFFNKMNLYNLEDGVKYAILVADHMFFFKKEQGFVDDFFYTISLYRNSKTKHVLPCLFEKKYVNDKEKIKLAEYIFKSLIFKRNQIGVLNLENMEKEYIFLKKNREYYKKSQIKFADILNKKEENADVKKFRKKRIEELSENAQNFLNQVVVYRKFFDLNSSYFPAVGIEYVVSDEYIECGYGRGKSFYDSTNIAMLEAVERYCSLYYPYKHKDIYNSYSNLENAINPRKFILPSCPNNPCLVYHDNLEIYWTEAESVRNKSTVLVPEQLAVYGDSFFRKNNHNRFIFDSSNGVALGGTFEEAVLYGLLELIERDNFLTTWYGQIPVDEVELNSLMLSDDLIKMINLYHEYGFSINIYNISMELGVPSFWALVRSTKKDGIYSYTAAGSNPIPSKAVESALLEALIGITIQSNLKNDYGIEIPKEVMKMSDHINYYSDIRNKDAFDFLKKSNKDSLKIQNYIQETNINSYLHVLIQNILNKYEDIYIVNLTSNEMEKLGIFTVKVLVPGFLPITFGAQNARISFSRINRERSRRGIGKIKEFNIYPHPFP